MPVVEKTSPGRVNVRGIGEFTRGDRADVSTADAEYLVEERGDFERVDEDEDVDTDGSAEQAELSDPDEIEGESGSLPFNPESHTNAEIEERVADIDDEAVLVALRNLEEDQKDRTGAKDAIDDRLNELEG